MENNVQNSIKEKLPVMKLSDELGVCPFCQNESLDYGSLELEDNSIYFPVICDNCGEHFKEYHNLVFNGNYGIQ